jgi:hypothetical protein
MFSLRALAAARNPPPLHPASAAVAAAPDRKTLLVEPIFISLLLLFEPVSCYLNLRGPSPKESGASASIAGLKST